MVFKTAFYVSRRVFRGKVFYGERIFCENSRISTKKFSGFFGEKNSAVMSKVLFTCPDKHFWKEVPFGKKWNFIIFPVLERKHFGFLGKTFSEWWKLHSMRPQELFEGLFMDKNFRNTFRIWAYDLRPYCQSFLAGFSELLSVCIKEHLWIWNFFEKIVSSWVVFRYLRGNCPDFGGKILRNFFLWKQ